MSTLTILIQHSTESPGQSNQPRERKKWQIENEEVKMLLFADDMLLYIENSTDSTKRLL